MLISVNFLGSIAYTSFLYYGVSFVVVWAFLRSPSIPAHVFGGLGLQALLPNGAASLCGRRHAIHCRLRDIHGAQAPSSAASASVMDVTISRVCLSRPVKLSSIAGQCIMIPRNHYSWRMMHDGVYYTKQAQKPNRIMR